MPFALTAIGAILVLTGINDTYAQFGAQLQNDMQGGYLKWAAAILIIGGLGYIKDLEPVTDLFLVLMIVALFLANKGGVFAEVTKAVNQQG